VENEGRVNVFSDFGALLRQHRLAAGLSQQNLAERAQMSVYGISALERGYRKTPQFETLTLLAGALALSADEKRAFIAAAQPRAVRGEGSVALGPWPSTGSARLPLSLTRFVGREAELDEIAALLLEHRFITLTGAGGVGKTQTALRAATALDDVPQTASCFVDFAPVGDPALVATTIATALGVQEVLNHPLIETLAAFLKNKTTLMVLDNCEHVIAEAATVADFLLRGCPNLRILATSREPLRTGGERTYRLPSLDESDAIALFEDRAQAVDARFTLTDENRPIVGEICGHLSGIPLAIELAAARVTVLPLRALAKALDDRFAVLVGGERTAPVRQQTMGAAIDWSYELLVPPEQWLFERLSVFTGGWTIDAAMAVCRRKGTSAGDTLTLISSLVGKSLVVADLESNEPRYRMLEPFREYAREKLKARGENDAVAQRHVLAYIEDAARFAPRDQHHTVYYGHARNEIGNWRAAVRWALTERNDVLAGQRLVAEVYCLWGTTPDVLSDGRRWIPAALELVDERTPSAVVAKLKLAEAELATHLGNYPLQLASAREAGGYYRESGNELSFLRAQTVVGNALYNLRDEPEGERDRIDEACEILGEALSLARKLSSDWDTTRVLRNLGVCLLDRDLVAARTYLTEALRIIKAADNQHTVELIAIDFAALSFREGNAESALRCLTDVFAEGRDLATPRRVAVIAQNDIAEYLIALGRYEEARKYASEALGTAREEHLDTLIADSLGRLISIAALRQTNCALDVRMRAARTLGFVDARVRALGSTTVFRPGSALDQAFAGLRDELGAEALADLLAHGATMTEDEAVAEAIRM
jgi:predicted ATPase